MSLRFTNWFNKKETNEKNQLDDMVVLAQNGDKSIRNQLLDQYKPFVKKTTSKACRRYVYESMDEFSIGLLAFNEAIDRYKKTEGHFLTFANVVIQRRIIDYIRQEQRVNKNIVHQIEEADEEYEESGFEQKRSIEVFQQENEKAKRVEEIQEYQKLLQQFGITFQVLSEQCPKHIDARENAKEIAQLVATDEQFSSFLIEKKKLPIKKIEDRVKCSRKTIERNRNYIMAMALIHIGNFHALKSFVTPDERRE
jgi:RNA polymerase sigma factor